MVSETRGANSEKPITTRYSYYEDADADGDNYGQLYRTDLPDGGWIRYTYDAQDRPTAEIRPFMNAPTNAPESACRVTRYTSAGDPALAADRFPSNDVTAPLDQRPRRIVEEAPGHEIARTYHAYLDGVLITKRCAAAGAAYDDPSNLVTRTQTFGPGPQQGRTRQIDHADGRISTYAYLCTNGLLTTILATGAGVDTVTNGTRTLSVTDEAGRTHYEETHAIPSDFLLSAHTNTYDTRGRLLESSNLVTGATSTRSYACCDLADRTVDEQGIETLHTYNALKQRVSSTRLGVTTYSTYDVYGQVVETRQSAPGQPDIVQTARYDAVGQRLSHTDERGFTTTYTYTTSPLGKRVEQTTYPDGATSLNVYYRDGSLQALRGSPPPLLRLRCR